MKNIERILLGIAGALMPILANIYFFDFSSLTFIWVTYLVKSAILIFTGALIGYLNSTETNKLKVFQLGLALPSLLTAIYSEKANQLKQENIKVENKTRTELYQPLKPEFNFPFFSSAYAQVQPPKKGEKYKRPEQSVLESIYQGITGDQPTNIWYVITASYPDENEAAAKAKEINDYKLGFNAVVYQPYQGNPNYAVILGSNLELEEAKQLRETAIFKGLAKDTYLWSLK